MKPRIPNSAEKKLLQKKGYNPKYFLTVDENHKEITFLETSSGKPVAFSKLSKKLDIILDLIAGAISIWSIAMLIQLAVESL